MREFLSQNVVALVVIGALIGVYFIVKFLCDLVGDDERGDFNEPEYRAIAEEQKRDADATD